MQIHAEKDGWTLEADKESEAKVLKELREYLETRDVVVEERYYGGGFFVKNTDA